MGALHARIVSQAAGAKLTCIIDPASHVGRPLADQYDTRWLPDLDGISLIDAVIVASTTETHAAWVDRALEAGKPVLVEKPLSTDLAEAEAMVKRSDELGIPIMCGFVERFNPAVQLAIQALEEPLFFQSIRHSPYPNRIRTGVAYDLLIHDADLAVRVFGSPPDDVSARFGYFHPASDETAEDVADYQLTFGRGQLAALSASRVSQRKIRNLSLSEAGRLLEIDLVRQDVTIYRHVAHEILEGASGYRSQTIIDVPAMPSRREPLASQFDHFLGLVRGSLDPDTERRSLLAPHQAVAAGLPSTVR